jgi:hypothetical protein
MKTKDWITVPTVLLTNLAVATGIFMGVRSCNLPDLRNDKALVEYVLGPTTASTTKEDETPKSDVSIPSPLDSKNLIDSVRIKYHGDQIIESAEDQAAEFVGPHCEAPRDYGVALDQIQEYQGMYGTEVAAAFFGRFDYAIRKLNLCSKSKERAIRKVARKHIFKNLDVELRLEIILNELGHGKNVFESDELIPARINRSKAYELASAISDMPIDKQKDWIKELCGDKSYLFTEPVGLHDGEAYTHLPNYARSERSKVVICRLLSKELGFSFRDAVGFYEGAPEIMRLPNEYHELEELTQQNPEQLQNPKWRKENLGFLLQQLADISCEAWEGRSEPFESIGIESYVDLIAANVESFGGNLQLYLEDTRVIDVLAKQQCGESR